ncbi:MAG: ATP-grasp domain-containing protein [Erysipelotrichales bacterium]
MNRKIIGIIGGGQLGMFLALEANRLGFNSAIYNDGVNCSAHTICNIFVDGKYDDEQRLRDFCKQCDVITYEFENIDHHVISKLCEDFNIPQGHRPLVLASNRLNEKAMATNLGIKQGRYYLKDKIYELNLEEYDYIFKTTTLGYDGKNQYLVCDVEDLDNIDYQQEYIIEEKIDFDYEMSLIGVRSLNKELEIYPAFINEHHNGILHISEEDSLNDSIYQQAYEAIEKIMEHYEIVGLLCVEFFVKDDEVYFNEIAPRPHNSGHITLDLNITSQYENHLKAILGMNLGSTKRLDIDAFMVNILGQDLEKVEMIIKESNQIKLYDYHKEARYNRKVGHLICYDYDLYDYFKETWRNE